MRRRTQSIDVARHLRVRWKYPCSANSCPAASWALIACSNSCCAEHCTVIRRHHQQRQRNLGHLAHGSKHFRDRTPMSPAQRRAPIRRASAAAACEGNSTERSGRIALGRFRIARPRGRAQRRVTIEQTVQMCDSRRTRARAGAHRCAAMPRLAQSTAIASANDPASSCSTPIAARPSIRSVSPAQCTRNHRRTARQGLECCQAKCLLVAGVHKDVRARQRARERCRVRPVRQQAQP